MRRANSTFWSLLIVALWIGRAGAQPVLEIRQPVPYCCAAFGNVMAPLGTNLLVGNGIIPGFGVPGDGLVYLFDPTGAVVRTFTNPGSFIGFGTSVAVVGGNVLIGVSDAGPGGGAAYLFDGTTGALLLTIPDPSPAANRLFGSVVAAFGNDILVSAPTYYSAPGEVDLFDGTTGALLQTFANPNPGYVDTLYDDFGGAIAGVGGHVVVGAFGEDASGPNRGAVYVFDPISGALERTIDSPSPSLAWQFFGSRIADAGGSILVGAPRTEQGGYAEAGAAYLFDPSTGALLRTFTSPTVRSEGGFGVSLAAGGGAVLIATNSGAGGGAYLFDAASGALLRSKPTPFPHGPPYSPGGSDDYGAAVALVGDNIAVSAPGIGPGVVHFYCGGSVGCGPCETCAPDGTCMLAPHPSCRTPVRPAHLRLTDATPDQGDLVTFNGVWPVAEVPAPFTTIDASQFGDPTTTSDMTLCAWDESGGGSSLAFRARVPADGDCSVPPCWQSPFHGTTYTYRDSDGTADGVTRTILTAVATRYTLPIRFKGKGVHLSDRPFGLPSPPLGLPLRAQLQAKDGFCWEATFSSPLVNGGGHFRAASD